MTIPEHGFLDTTGGNWRCDRGFKKTGSSCAAIDVPNNAHINNSGEGWECNRPYRRLDEKCV